MVINSDSNKSKTFVLGDVHGSYNALSQVLERANFNNKEDKLIALGDFCDGWSQTAEVVEFLINLQEESGGKHVFIKGNHDTWVQKWLNQGSSDMVWLMNGGSSTAESYQRTGFLTEQSHKDFFNDLQDFHVDTENRAFVHAGFRSDKGLGQDDEHTYFWERLFWSMQMQPQEPEFNPSRFYKEVYIGHTPTVNFVEDKGVGERNGRDMKNGITTPMLRNNVWNMDTGSGWTGKLSLMNIDTKELFQSDIVSTLHPDEKGRMG